MEFVERGWGAFQVGVSSNLGVIMLLGACKPDIRNFCSQVAPGGGRIKACMKEHLHELSEPCKEAMFQAWLREQRNSIAAAA